jgi:hypothetical protein
MNLLMGVGAFVVPKLFPTDSMAFFSNIVNYLPLYYRLIKIGSLGGILGEGLKGKFVTRHDLP